MESRPVKSRQGLCTLVFVLGATLSSWAAPLPVANPGFESDVLAPGGAKSGITDWLTGPVGENSGPFHPTLADPPVATEGVNVAFLNLDGTAATANGLYQTVLPSLAANTIYTVTFDVGNRGGLNTRDVDSTFSGFFTLGGDASFVNAVGVPFTITLAAVPDGTFLTDQTFTFSTVDFVGSLSQPLNIAFLFQRPAGTTDINQAEIDNVRATATLVPEPSALLLFAVGGIALVLRRRK